MHVTSTVDIHFAATQATIVAAIKGKIPWLIHSQNVIVAYLG